MNPTPSSGAPGRRRAAAALLFTLALGTAPAAWAADVALGDTLYHTGPGGAMACATCHGADPGNNVSNVMRGANRPAVIAAAIAANKGGMGLFTGLLSSTELDNLAAYIGSRGPAAVVLSPTSLAFPGTAVGSSASALLATLSNIGGAPLSVSALTLSGAAAADYQLTGSTCAAGGSVAAGASCTVRVVFAPSATGARAASLAISHNASGGGSALALSGTGTAAPTPSIVLSASSLGLGTVPQGASSAAQSLTVQNSGLAPLVFSAIGLAGSQPADFALGGSCSASLPVAAGASCSVEVRFTPTALGARAASLVLASNAANGASQSVALSGTGSAAPVPIAVVAPTTLAFGAVLAGGPAATRHVTVNNTGTAPLLVGTLALSGAGASAYAIGAGNTCAAPVAAGASCTIPVLFASAVAGSQPGQLGIPSNGSGSPLVVALSGFVATQATGLPVLSQSSALPFSDTRVGQASAVQSVSLGNAGATAFTLSSLGLSGAGAADYVLSGDCAAAQVIAPGAWCSVGSSFRPSVAGERSATLTLATDLGATLTLQLSGTGLAAAAPVLALPATATDFGPLGVGETALRKLLLQNTGGVDATITTATATGAYSLRAGSASGDCAALPFTLPAGASCELTLQFSPTLAGADEGLLSVAAEGAAPVTSPLTGSGAAAAMAPQNQGGGGCTAAVNGRDPMLPLLVVLALAVAVWRRRAARAPVAPSAGERAA